LIVPRRRRFGRPDGSLRNYEDQEGPYEDPVETAAAMMSPMADFLVVLGIVVFAAAMLGLIWALDRV
jgi:hypothetical protein